MPLLQSQPSLISLDELASPQGKLWMPQRVLFTPAALEESHGQKIYERVRNLGLPVKILKANRLTGLRGEDERATYNIAKRTLAIVNTPPSAMKLQPIPPSADWQFHIAEGCPAHCQYCYLAGSLSGPPVVRAFANLPQILENLKSYEGVEPTSFEVSCYTDPLGIEHLTGSLAECIRAFGASQNSYLRFVTKFDAVDELLALPHNGHVLPRVSLNAAHVSRRLEGGTAKVEERLMALRKLALPVEQGGGNYPAGIVLAPIMAFDGWQEDYNVLFDQIEQALDWAPPLTFELITHRFTPGSKEVLLGWYPKTSLDLDESTREAKRNKFGGTKWVYPRAQMKTMRAWFESEIARRFPQARVLYWT